MLHVARLLPAFMAFLATTVIIGGGASAISLEETLAEAFQSNPDLIASRAALRATATQIAQARGGYLPTITGSAEYKAQRGNQRFSIDFGAEESALLQLVEDLDADVTSFTRSLDQNLYRGGGTVAAMSRARNRLRSSRSALAATEQNVLLDAATAYVRVWRDRATVEEAARNTERLRERLRRTRRVHDLGEVTFTDVRQAEARLANGEADADGHRAELSDAEAFYERVVGAAPGPLERPWLKVVIPPTLEDASTRAENAPEVAQARYDLAAAEDDVDVAFADLLPTVGLSGQLNRQNEPSTIVDSSESAFLGVKLTVPFFQGGVAIARVRENREMLEQRRSALAGEVRRAKESIRSAWNQLLIARSQLASYQAEVDANRLALEGVEREAQLGRRTTLDVLDAENDLFDARLNVLRADADAIIATFRIKQAVGELTADRLQQEAGPKDRPAPPLPVRRPSASPPQPAPARTPPR